MQVLCHMKRIARLSVKLTRKKTRSFAPFYFHGLFAWIVNATMHPDFFPTLLMKLFHLEKWESQNLYPHLMRWYVRGLVSQKRLDIGEVNHRAMPVTLECSLKHSTLPAAELWSWFQGIAFGTWRISDTMTDNNGKEAALRPRRRNRIFDLVAFPILVAHKRMRCKSRTKLFTRSWEREKWRDGRGEKFQYLTCKNGE